MSFYNTSKHVSFSVKSSSIVYAGEDGKYSNNNKLIII